MTRLILALAAAAILSGCASGAAATDDFARETRDRHEIEALLWRYVRALDTLDADTYASVFTEDGRFSSGGAATEGREALHAMVADMRQGRVDREARGEPPTPPMYHVIANSHLEFLDADRARFHSYWMTVFGAAGPGTPVRVAAAGRGVDELVRVDGRWLIASRNVAPQD
jgi:3-phenylpropionate/cinnamic acid dioxygenase small subunit